jgi:glycosyltransferase involved in cell wall biosynthesis
VSKSAQLVFICGNLYPYNLGGAEVFNHYLMRSFAAETTLSAINTKTDKKEDGIGHIKIAPSFLEVLLFPLLTALKLVGMRRRGKLHLVLTFSRSRWIYWVIYPLLRNLFGIHYSIIIHGGGLMKWKFEAPFQWLFNRADHVIGISERITQEYADRTGLAVKFIPPLIPFTLSKKPKETCRETLGIDPRSKVVLMVGSLKPLKHPETSIDAFSKLGSTFLKTENLLLLFAGDGADRPALEKQAVDLGIQNHVRFLGNVPREEVKHVYRASDFYVMASDFEGTPLSMLEAMANNLPVLASNAPGINTIVENGKNGLLFTIGNGNELAEHLKTALSDGELSQTLTNNAKGTLAERYDHGQMLERYRKLWDL